MSASTPLAVVPVAVAPQGRDAAPRKATPFHRRTPTDDEWGRSESLDSDNVGDIADEGAGHRG